MNVLLVGTDTPPAGQVGRADTLVIVHLPADGSAIYLVSLPRVAQALLPQGVIQLRTSRVIGGVPLTVRGGGAGGRDPAGSRGGNGFLEGFAGLADVVGGVTVTNPHASTGDGGRGVPEGPLTLHGREALAFVRDHSVTDQVRTERQRSVLKAVLAKLPLAIAVKIRSTWPGCPPTWSATSTPTTRWCRTFRRFWRRAARRPEPDRRHRAAAAAAHERLGPAEARPAGMAVLAQALRDGTMAHDRLGPALKAPLEESHLVGVCPIGGDEGTRTLNLDLAKVLRCQLRHVPGRFPLPVTGQRNAQRS